MLIPISSAKEESIAQPILFTKDEVGVVRLNVDSGVAGDNWAD